MYIVLCITTHTMKGTQYPAASTRREPPFGARRTGGGCGNITPEYPAEHSSKPGRRRAVTIPRPIPVGHERSRRNGAATRVVPQRITRLCLLRGTKAFFFFPGKKCIYYMVFIP